MGGRPHCHSQGPLPLPTGNLRGLHSPLVTHQLRLPFKNFFDCSMTYEILPAQPGIEPMPPALETESEPLDHQGSPMLVAQSCLTLCNPMDCRLPGFSVHGILQGRTLEWIAILFSRGTSQPRDCTLVSCLTGRFFTI